MTQAVSGVQLIGTVDPQYSFVLSKDALEFVARLHREFNPSREKLLRRRAERQLELEKGRLPDFLPETADVRAGDWRVAAAPKDLDDRRVEITGPVEPKMMINALNSGAKVFMGDFEDSLSPTWDGVLLGQKTCFQAVRRNLDYKSPEGKEYALKDKLATLLVRPRGWHLVEKHVLVDGQPISASLFDFGLYFFHNAKELLKRGSGPYFYLPKLESHLEARLWNDVFVAAQKARGVPHGSIRATVLIETIFAAFEMDEILYELRNHAAGLNAGRWDYIFSVIKKFRNSADFLLPDRAQVSMASPFMRAYTELLVKTCHRRGAHAIGGMAAFIPSRKDAAVNEVAMKKVREDKERESGDGFDGTWVAHPDLVPVAQEIFDRVLGAKPNQKQRLREEVKTDARDLLQTRIPGAAVTTAGVKLNINVAIQYLEKWLEGTGAVGIHNLMEDAATAEISRAQLWQWIRHGAALEDGSRMSAELYAKFRDGEVARLSAKSPRPAGGKFPAAIKLLDRLVLDREFAEFLTIPAYDLLD